ncbi:hypothetical protein BSKO_12009 [Bryopsis sp. KO-2023]|nr:hypothetical protein BSKO_12009 [Bryopsis sp. KO-2023]
MFWGVMSLIGIAGALGAAYFVTRSYCDRLERQCRTLSRARFLDPYSNQGVSSPSLFSEPTKFLSVVFPAYEEEDRLPSTLQETFDYLSRRRSQRGSGFSFEIIVVDDGSRDGTSARALEFSKKHGTDYVRVLKLEKNVGKGAAVREGMLRCRGAICLFADSDAATEFSDIEKLEAQLRYVAANQSEPENDEDVIEARWIGEGPASKRKEARNRPLSRDIHDYDLCIASKLGAVFGSRAHLEKAALARRAFHRNVLTHGFHFLVAFVVGKRIKDTQCGFKLFTRSTASKLFPNQRMRRYCFDVELIRLAQKFKVPLAEVNVKWTEVAGSKVKFHHIAQMAWELVLIKLGHGILDRWELKGADWLEHKKEI